MYHKTHKARQVRDTPHLQPSQPSNEMVQASSVMFKVLPVIRFDAIIAVPCVKLKVGVLSQTSAFLTILQDITLSMVFELKGASFPGATG